MYPLKKIVVNELKGKKIHETKHQNRISKVVRPWNLFTNLLVKGGPFSYILPMMLGNSTAVFCCFRISFCWKTWRVVFVSHRSINLVRQVDCFSRPINREGKKMWESFRHSLFLRSQNLSVHKQVGSHKSFDDTGLVRVL